MRLPTVIVSVVLLVFGLLIGQPLFTLLGLALVLWLTAEGLLFAFRARWVVRGLRLHRQLCDDRGPVISLWAGRTFEVRLTLLLEEGYGLPYVAIEEPRPASSAAHAICGSLHEVSGILRSWVWSEERD